MSFLYFLVLFCFYTAQLSVVAGALNSGWRWFFLPLGAPDVMSFPLALGLVLMLGIVLTLTAPRAQKDAKPATPKPVGVQSAAEIEQLESDIETAELARFINHMATRTLIVLLLWWVAYVAHLHI